MLAIAKPDDLIAIHHWLTTIHPNSLGAMPR
jgi:hypothetical protein